MTQQLSRGRGVAPGQLKKKGAPIDAGLLGWWRCQKLHYGGKFAYNLVTQAHGTLEQYTANAYSASVRPGSDEVQWNFYGADSRIAVPAATLKPTAAITWACWVYLDASATRGVLNNRQAAAGRTGWVVENAVDGLHFYLWTTGAGAYVDSGGGTQQSAEWHHWAGTYDGSNVRIFRDGLTVGTSAATSGTISYDANTDMYIGAEYITGDDRVWDGSIDDVMIFSRALSESQVGQIYHESKNGWPGVFDVRETGILAALSPAPSTRKRGGGWIRHPMGVPSLDW